MGHEFITIKNKNMSTAVMYEKTLPNTLSRCVWADEKPALSEPYHEMKSADKVSR